MDRRLFLAAESLAPGNGGICRVARLIAKVVGEQTRARSLSADAIALSDKTSSSEFGFPCLALAGSRGKFAFHSYRQALSHSHFIYDFVGMARAHCQVPLMRRPFMTYIHGIEVWEGTRPDRVKWARRADFLLSNSVYTRDRAERTFGGFSHARVCWLSTENDEPAPPAVSASGPPTVVIVGRMDEAAYKGHAELIDCWASVASAVPGARLLIVGRGVGESAFRQRAAASPVSQQIEFAGFVSEERMEQIWSEAAVFAMPSRGEGFGLVYIEAMRHGVPVIASIHDAAPEVNLDGVSGFNVNLDQPEQLRQKLVELLTNRDLRNAMGEAGKRRWEQHFCYSAFRERFTPLLQEFLDGN